MQQAPDIAAAGSNESLADRAITRDVGGQTATYAVIGLAAALLLPRLGARALWASEFRWAEIAREMLSSGEWIVPRLYGVTYLEKPPLLYWLVAGAFRLFGLSELAARIVPALSATIGAVATGYGAAAIFGAEVGALAVTILSTSLLYFTLAHAVVTDVPLPPL